MTVTSAATVVLAFNYDAATGVYTVSDSGNSSSFGEAQSLDFDGIGDAQFGRATETGFERLTLFDPARLGGGTHHVTAGLWQRRVAEDAMSSKFEFDVFMYGFPTARSGVPVSGSATYDIDLFGVASPIGAFPRSVEGSGTLSLDFAHGVYAMSGQATEYNNDVDYYTCCAEWRGGGYLTANGGLTGRIAYNGRDIGTYRGAVVGTLFGATGSEVGGSFTAQARENATFTGVFAGTRERDGTDSPLHVLGEGTRDFYTVQGFTAIVQSPGENGSSAAGSYFPANYGRIRFATDGSVTLIPGIRDDQYEDVTFTRADIVSERSDARFTAYEVDTANGNYQLDMSRPGPRNPDIQLTYSSFGRWQETRTVEATRRHLATWFVYGARTAVDTLPTTGRAHFDATVLGSGERLTDAEPLTVSGTSSIDIDFATMSVAGTFDATAWTTSNERIELPALTFGSTYEGAGFNTTLQSAPGIAPGSIAGGLYGPGGEEIGGSFEFFTRPAEGAEADATYAGVFYGKRD